MKPTPLNYRGQPLTQPVLRLHDPVPAGPAVPPRVLPAALRIASVFVGLASLVVHALLLAILLSVAAEQRGRIFQSGLWFDLFVLLILAAAACSGLLLVVVSFARQRRWIFAWVAVEFLVTVALSAVVLPVSAQGTLASQHVLLRTCVALIYTGVVAWMALPPARA